MKTKLMYSFMASAAILAFSVASAQSQTTIITGNLEVSGTTDVEGNTLTLGSWSGSNSVPGILFNYIDSGTAVISLTATRNAVQWQWLTNSGTGMILDQSNNLLLYSGTVANVKLSPNASGTSAFAGSVTFGGANNTLPNQTLVNSSSILTESLGDNRYLSLTAASGYLTQAAASTEYVSSSNLIVKTGTEIVGPYQKYTAPAIALVDGTATGYASFAGIMSSATAGFDVALGFWARTGFGSVAIGEGALAIGTGAGAIGPCNEAQGVSSAAVGSGCTASGDYSAAIGVCSIAGGLCSTAIGVGSTANGIQSTASAPNSVANGVYSTAAGANTVAASWGEFDVGQFNQPMGSGTSWVATDPLFVVGNGPPEYDAYGNQLFDTNNNPISTLSNAFVVYKDGDAALSGVLVVSGTTGNQNVINNGGLIVSGTVGSDGTTIVSGGTNQLVLIPQQGDLGMGNFTAGAQPQAPGGGQAMASMAGSSGPMMGVASGIGTVGNAGVSQGAPIRVANEAASKMSQLLSGSTQP